MVHQMHPIVARTIVEAVEANDPAQTAQGVLSSIDSLRTAGFVVPSWNDLIREGPNQGPVEEEDPSQPRFGRQKDAAVAVRSSTLPVAVHSTATTGLRARGREFWPWLPDGVRNGTDLPRGWRVRTNVMVCDLDLGAFNHLVGRRLEIIADGLPSWRGAQLAIDTTLVSPIRADGTARRHSTPRWRCS